MDDARSDYVRSFPKISPERAAGSADPALGRDFIYWLQSGFAFTLPLLALGVILLIVLVAVFNR